MVLHCFLLSLSLSLSIYLSVSLICALLPYARRRQHVPQWAVESGQHVLHERGDAVPRDLRAADGVLPQVRAPLRGPHFARGAVLRAPHPRTLPREGVRLSLSITRTLSLCQRVVYCTTGTGVCDCARNCD